MIIDLKINAMRVKGPGCVVPFMACTGICCSTGYGFVLAVPKQDIIFRMSVLKMVYNFV